MTIIFSCNKSNELKDFDLFLYFVDISYSSNEPIALYTKNITPINKIKSFNLDKNQVLSFERILGIKLDTNLIIINGMNITDIYSIKFATNTNSNKIEKKSKKTISDINKSITDTKNILYNKYNMDITKEYTSKLSYYNKLLIFNSLPENNSTNKMNMALDLWINSDILYKELYTKETLKIFTYINQLSENNSDFISLSDSIISLGNISYKEEVIKVVYLKNKSEYPIVITSIESTCNCSTAIFPKYPLKKNSIDSIKIKFKGTSLGINIKNIRLKFSGNKTLNIQVKANVTL